VSNNEALEKQLPKEIFVVIGCDTDPDRDYFIPGTPSDTLSWRGMLEGIPRAKDKLETLTDSDGRPPVFTWLLRADHQIKQVHGSFNHILSTHRDFLLDVEKTGDELGWHPHFWCFDEKRRAWYQNHEDIDWQVSVLEQAHAAYCEVLPGRPKTVRMGWGYHNDRTCAALDRLGIEVEISGLPGLRVRSEVTGSRLSNFYDWYSTPAEPFHPSTSDYRRPAKEGESSYSLLEVPNFVSRSRFWGMVSGVVMTRKMKNIRQIGYSLAKPAYMATVTVKPTLFAPMVSEMKRRLSRQDRVIYVTPLHPDELIDNIHPAYSLQYMAQNIKSILNLADSLGAKARFVRAIDIKTIVQTGAAQPRTE